MIEQAQRKLAVLVQAAEDARALAHSAKERASVLAAKVSQLGNAHASEVEIIKAAEQHERAADLQQSRYRAWQQHEELVTRIKAWLNELPRNVTLETMPAPTVAMNGSPAVVVGGLRSQIANLISEHHAIKLAPAPIDDGRRQARELVAMLGRKGQPRITNQFGTVSIFGWDNPAQEFGPTFHSKMVESLCWLMPDTVIAKIDEVIEALPHNTDALPLDQRKERLAEIENEITRLEHEEEAVIMLAAKDNISIPRRDDASPSAILGVRIAKPVSARVAA